jgi:hypothetical protein
LQSTCGTARPRWGNPADRTGGGIEHPVHGDAYYSAAHPNQAVPGLRPTDPDYNVYLRTPGSEWHDLANDRIRKNTKLVEQQCDPFGPPELVNVHPMGDWQDNTAGFEQALQDIAAGRAPWTTTPPGYSGDPDCD